MALAETLREVSSELENAVRELAATSDDPGSIEHWCLRMNAVALAIRLESIAAADAEKALEVAGIARIGSMAARIERLASERDLLIDEMDDGREASPDRCPDCGYTEVDARELGDHKLCKKYPFFTFEKAQ